MSERSGDSAVERLLGPVEPELLCAECFEKLDEYVELEHAGGAADEKIPGMRPHLKGCPACHEEYQSLSELIRAEEK